MACHRVDVPGGGAAIICGPSPRVSCVVCRAPATRLCDGHDAEDADGVCSAGLCDRHTRREGEHDLCPRHAAGELAISPPRLPSAARARTGHHQRPRLGEQLSLPLGGRR